MPELPEVFTVVNQLRPGVLGSKIVAARVFWERSVRPISAENFISTVTGKTIADVKNIGKNILIDLSAGYIHIHLRMTGRLYIVPSGVMNDSDSWLRVNMILADNRELHFSDSRKLGLCTYSNSLPPVIRDLGPEPHSIYFTPEYLYRKVTERRSPIKSIIMDQQVVAGIGNIYADESLWRAQISPLSQGNVLNDDQIILLHQCIIDTISDALEREGSSINWYRKPDGKEGSIQESFNVYDRQNLPCPRCGNPVVKIRLGGRGTHFCPYCQVESGKK